MALTEPQAKVLGALSTLGPWQAFTVRELSKATGLPANRIRAVLLRLSYDGLALGSSKSPADYWISRLGRAVIASPTYREYRTRRDTTNVVSK
jgi:sugar-specific transcriptional regulator TrmB